MIWPGRNHNRYNPYQETIKLSGVFGMVPRTRHSGLHITNTWSGNSTPAVSESWSVHIPHKVCGTKLPIQFKKIRKTAQIVGYVSPAWHLHNIPITIGFKPHSPGKIPGFR